MLSGSETSQKRFFAVAQNDSFLYCHVEELSDETSKRFFASAQNDRKKKAQNDVSKNTETKKGGVKHRLSGEKFQCPMGTSLRWTEQTAKPKTAS